MHLSRWMMGLCLVVACSGKSGSNSPGGGSGIDEACQRDADSYCDKLAACSPFSLQWTYGDAARCKERDKLWCKPFLSLPDIASTPASFNACSDAVEAQTCDDFNAAVSLAICKGNPGPRADGQVCTSGAQCQSQHCKIPAMASCGVCAEKVPIGSMCDTTSDCVSGSRCRQQKCIPEATEGSACGAGVAVCVYPNTCLNSVCTKPLRTGAACDPMLDACDFATFGDVCDPLTITCKQLVTLAMPGQPCGLVNGVQTQCVASGSCVYSTTDPNVGTCQAAIADGAPCDPTGNTFCEWPAECLNGTCKVPFTGPTCQ
jgi:hypothetical protein